MLKIRDIFLISWVLICFSLMSINAAPNALKNIGDPGRTVGAPVEKGPSKKSALGGLFRKKAPSSNPTSVKKGAVPVKSEEPLQNPSPSKPAVGLPTLPLKQNNGCPCYAPAIYSPVCGSDKKIYANKYLLECENKCANKNLKVVKEGKC